VLGHQEAATTTAKTTTRATAMVPGIGGLLVPRQLARARQG
jgi:hypothetical protein